MSATLKFLAFDLGAESGRGVIGHFDGAKLRLEDVHRFPNGGVRCGDTLYWNTFRLWTEIKHAATLAAKQHGADLAGIGVDTWGVDFGLLDRNGELIGAPVCYRDPRNGPAMAAALRKVPRKEIYASTGLQFMQFNTLFQLYALARKKSPQLDGAATFLMMPDLFNYWFSGKKVCEYSIASTTQFLNARKKTWDTALLKKLGIPTRLLPKIVKSGTVLGPLLKSVREETGLGPVPVIAIGCHDTASAVAAVPARGRDHCYISSGTWSLMGAELDAPLINDKTAGYNFTNEGGVCGTVRFLKNIMGLWLVQECRRSWERAGEKLHYNEIMEAAASAPSLVSIVEPDHKEFLAPADMPVAIQDFCKRTGQPVPQDKGAIARCALESLALKYRWTLERIEECRGRGISVIHIVGGGTQNTLLNQLAADATGRTVITGPIEGTAIGNILMQAIARREIKSLDEAREVVRQSFPVFTYEPSSDRAKWDDAYARYLEVSKAATAF
ncbi:MAG: rhamnulokinase [Verrucomicrobia bacterium]|nr:rhamnulokinase [Verrucomicrobiota bacterium]